MRIKEIHKYIQTVYFYLESALQYFSVLFVSVQQNDAESKFCDEQSDGVCEELGVLVQHSKQLSSGHCVPGVLWK